MSLREISDHEVSSALNIGRKFVLSQYISDGKIDEYAPSGADAYKIIFPSEERKDVREYKGYLLVEFYKLNE